MASYATTFGPELLSNGVRRALLEWLEHHPGAALKAICDATGLPKGTVQYHVYVLSRRHLVKSVQTVRTRRYFVKNVDSSVARAGGAILHGRAGEVATFILLNPGAFQKTMLDSLGMTRKIFRWCLTLLVDHGLAEERHIAGRKAYFPTGRLHQVRTVLRAGTPGDRPLDSGPRQKRVETISGRFGAITSPEHAPHAAPGATDDA